MTPELDTIRDAIEALPSPVILREDLAMLGTPDAVAAAIAELTTADVIRAIGDGVYARTRPAVTYPGLTLEYSLHTLALEYAERLGATVVPTYFEFEHWMGRSTQVPVGAIIGVDRPLRARLYLTGGTLGPRYEYEPEGVARLAELGVDRLYRRPTRDAGA